MCYGCRGCGKCGKPKLTDMKLTRACTRCGLVVDDVNVAVCPQCGAYLPPAIPPSPPGSVPGMPGATGATLRRT